jgi:hypothetical protein
MKRIITATKEISALDRGRATGQIISAIKGLTAKGADSIMDEIKFYLKGGHSQANLEKLFDSQILRLGYRGVNDNIVNQLRDKRQAVIKKALELKSPFDRIPFLPVITKQQINLKMLLPLLFHDKAGATRLEHYKLSNIVETPTTPYYIIDVDDGDWLKHIAPMEAEATVRQYQRACLTDCEVIALSLHTDVLARHYLMALGSRYSNGVEEQFPDLHLCNGKPLLDWRHLKGSPAKQWGAPSCSLRY